MSAEILIVDDECAIADLVEVYMKNEGYTVHKFYNATDALSCVGREHVDLAILDVMLPDMDGFTLCQKIREQGSSSCCMAAESVWNLMRHSPSCMEKTARTVRSRVFWN